MIEKLNGNHETVVYKEHANIRLYDNTDFEEYPTHWHTAIEIIMPVENHYVIENDDEIYNIQEGEILIICPNVLHTLYAVKGRRYILQAEIGSVIQIKELDSVLSLLSPIIYLTQKNAPAIYSRIHSLLLQIVDDYSQSQPLCEAAIYAKLLDMLVTIGKNHTDNLDRFGVSHLKQKEYIGTFMQICNYINAHCTEDLSLEEVASLSGFSKYHFSRLFKQFANVTFYKYLNQKRIAIAEQLLIDPTISVTNVSMQCGFDSLSAFIRMFKIIKGCTPSEFRTMYTSNSSYGLRGNVSFQSEDA